MRVEQSRSKSLFIATTQKKKKKKKKKNERQPAQVRSGQLRSARLDSRTDSCRPSLGNDQELPGCSAGLVTKDPHCHCVWCCESMLWLWEGDTDCY